MSATFSNRVGRWIAASAATASLVALSAAAALGANPSRQSRSTEYPLRVIAFETTPKRPKAGKPFVAVAAIVNEETAEPISGDIRCPARIGRRGIRILFKDLDMGVAGCSWRIPAGAGGKRFAASIEVTSDDGYAASVPFSRVIRR